MKLAVHDLLTRNTEDSVADVFAKTKELVQELEKLGYHRYWFAEHHGISQHLASAPEILAAYFAATTQNMRIGSGGTMIMHYSPLKIAEIFKTLSALAPGRIDLGMGNAPGCGMKELLALAEGRRMSPPDFENYLYPKMLDILAFLQDETPVTQFYKNTKAVPEHPDTLPQAWVLGSTGRTAKFAAEHGLPYSHARFFAVDVPADPFLAYKENFKASPFASKPCLGFSYQVAVAETSEEADYLAKPYEVALVRNQAEDVKEVQAPEAVKDIHFTEKEKAKIASFYRKNFLIKGSKAEVAAILEEEIEKFKLDELMFYIPLYHQADRLMNYRLLAEIFL